MDHRGAEQSGLGEAHHGEQLAAHVGVVGHGGEELTDRHQLAGGRLVRGERVDPGGVHRRRAVGRGAAGPDGDLGIGGVRGGGGAEPEVVDLGGDLGEGGVGGRPSGVDGRLVGQSARVAVGDLGLDGAERGAERRPHLAEIGASLGPLDLVQVRTDRQSEQGGDRDDERQCGGEQLRRQCETSHVVAVLGFGELGADLPLHVPGCRPGGGRQRRVEACRSIYRVAGGVS